MSICSEGSLIEVFGLHDEYLFTFAPLFVDDWEGMAVYSSRVTLPGIRRCKLKFKRTKEKSRLWIYGIQLLVAKSEESSHQSSFNFNNISKLGNDNVISEKAEMLKRMFEMRAQESGNAKSETALQLVLRMMQRGCNIQAPKLVPAPLGDVNITHPTGNSVSPSGVGENKELAPYCELKGYIDHKTTQMKVEIMAHLEAKLAELRDETHAKLDKIIKLLEQSQV